MLVLLDVYELMGLQGEMPLGVLLDVLHTLARYFAIALGIAGVAWLQVEVMGLRRGPRRRVVDTIEDDLHLVDLLGCECRSMVDKATLGRERHPVDGSRQRTGAVGLDGDVEALAMERVDKCLVDLQRRLATRENYKAAVTPLADGGNYLGSRQLAITLEVGVAEGTTQVTAAEAHEDGCTTGMAPLALQRIEYLVDAVGLHRATSGIRVRWGNGRHRPGRHCRQTL